MRNWWTAQKRTPYAVILFISPQRWSANKVWFIIVSYCITSRHYWKYLSINISGYDYAVDLWAFGIMAYELFEVSQEN